MTSSRTELQPSPNSSRPLASTALRRAAVLSRSRRTTVSSRPSVQTRFGGALAATGAGCSGCSGSGDSLETSSDTSLVSARSTSSRAPASPAGCFSSLPLKVSSNRTVPS